MDEVLFVAAGQGGALVFVSLPPDEARNFETLALVTRIVLLEVLQHGFRMSRVGVVLTTGIPGNRLRIRTLVPKVGDVLVARVNLPFELKLLATGGQQVPAEAAVADARLKEQYRFVMY